MDVAVIDVPAVWTFGIAAAGEVGHGLMIAPTGSGVKPLDVGPDHLNSEFQNATDFRAFQKR
jgi:hypothetical protein